jgi:phage-related protein
MVSATACSRSERSPTREHRVLFCIEESTMVLLHGFHKKTRKTSPDDVALARRRQKGK